MRLQEVVDMARAQGKTHVIQFIHDMRRMGRKLQRYHEGMTWWPAVVCDQPRDVLSSTSAVCESSARGPRFLVRPSDGFSSLSQAASHE